MTLQINQATQKPSSHYITMSFTPPHPTHIACLYWQLKLSASMC